MKWSSLTALLFFAIAAQAATTGKLTHPAQAYRHGLVFEPNQGQSESGVRFLARGTGHMILLKDDGAVFALRSAPLAKADRRSQRQPRDTRTHLIRMRFEGGAASPISAEDRRGSYSNYFIGNDTSQWHGNVPHYGRARQVGVYPGIDVVYYGADSRMEFDLIVKPGADPARIALRWEGVTGLRLDEAGSLLLATPVGEMIQHSPKVYQEFRGQRIMVPARYRLRDGVVTFELGRYNRNLPLVIDPVFTYTTYFGTSSSDIAWGVAVDSAKNAYVCGDTEGANFPTGFPSNNTYSGVRDAFVLKLNPAGTALIYSTFLGGSGIDQCFDVAIDPANNVYLTGITESDNFPRVNPFDNTRAGQDGFVTKINAGGNALVYSTFLGGSGFDIVHTIAVDERGSAYAGGSTNSGDYPVTPGAFDTTFNGVNDCVITKLEPAGNTLAFSTYLGGSDSEFMGDRLAIDGAGNVYVTGQTFSANFPTTPGAFDTAAGLPTDCFVTKINPTGSGLSYSTFVGGSGTIGAAVAVDAFGRAYVTGRTSNANFPVTAGAHNTTFSNGGFGSGFEGFVIKLNSDGSALHFATFLGGTGSDSPLTIGVDNAGNVIVAGRTRMTGFPLVGNLDNSGTSNVFAGMLNPTGSTLLFSSYCCGRISNGVAGAVDADGDFYIAGDLGGAFPAVVNGSFDTTHNGGNDAFAVKVSNFGFPPCIPQPATQNFSAPAVGPAQNTFAVTAPAGNACTWTAISGHPGVVNVNAPASKSGNGNTSYSLGSNSSAGPRFMSIATADWLHNISQAGTSSTQVYTDVPSTQPFFLFIQGLQMKDITRGCTATEYCPSQTVTRGQMAVFIIRSLAGDNFAFPTAQRFTDVPPGHIFFKYIQVMASLGITSGCAADRYCPDDTVTRGQMAVFILRALAGNNFPFPQTAVFNDAPASHPFFKYIQALFQRGITSGTSTNPPLYGTGGPVTREQMAAFLMRAFSIK